MSKGSSQTVNNRSDPWEPAQPHLKNILRDAQALYNSRRETPYYPFQTVVDPSVPTQSGLALLESRARRGSPLVQAAQQSYHGLLNGEMTDPAFQTLKATARGDYVDDNPHFGLLADRIQEQVDSRFSAGGRTGSGAHQSVTQRGLNELSADLYGQERGRQLSAAQGLLGARMQAGQLAPAIDAAGSIADAGRLLSVGRTHEDFRQAQIEDQMRRWQAPFGLLNQYQNIALGSGRLGGTQTGATRGRESDPLRAVSVFNSVLGHFL